MRLPNLDLNLLVALDALLEERSVTRAAARVGMTQPAMSNALARLRRLFHDPLLIKTPAGMTPTPRGLELAAPIRAALATISAALAPPGAFDPAAQHTFSAAAADYVELVLLPPLMAALSARAPNVSLAVSSMPGGFPRRELEAGRLDLAFGVFAEEFDGFYKKPLLRDRLLCAAREGHPALSRPPSVEEFCALSHVLVSQRGESKGVVDAALEKRGLSRRVALFVPHYLAAPLVVAKSDFVATLPERLITAFEGILPLRRFEPPLPLPGFTLSMVWHQRTQASPPHRWLREAIAALAPGL